jgi:predicted CXXCH cytochrome family protein
MRQRRWSSVVASAALLLGALRAGPASAELRSSAHDFSAPGQDGLVCAGCHTPHSTKPGELAWSSARPTNFHWGDAFKTSGGTTLPTNINTWTGPTKMCLTCHDGTIDARSFSSPRGPHVFSLGGDLKGNHPVAIPYPYSRAKNTYNGITTGDQALRSGWVATPQDVKLYADPAGPAPYNHGIECTSCHDPHGTENVKFLRASMAQGLCFRCHAK